MPDSSTHDVEPRIARLEQQEERLTRALELLAQGGVARAGKRRRNWDALAAVIASFVGLLALAVSGYTAYVQREQLRAQVWPRVQPSYNNVGSVGMFVTNQGTGPARVIAVRVAVDGVPATRWADVKKAAGYSAGEGIITSSLNWSVIPAGKEIAFLRPDEQERSLARFRELLPGGKHGVELTLCYCSVLDECWAIGANLWQSTVPGTVESCPITASERFLD